MAASCKASKKNKNEQKALIVQYALILSTDGNAESWIIDSGASFLATSNREVLQNYVASDFEKVYLGDDEPCNIVGKDNVEIKIRDLSGV